MNNIKKRGFGSMSPERRQEIARLGGQSAHAKGSAHRFTSEEARAAGQRGGRSKKKT
ncbi:MAG: KGG domain-containing protein [Patescibacteria group bacterium]|jgi:general stress protein YciG